MKKFNIKHLAIFALSAMMPLSLVGCGGGDEANASGADSSGVVTINYPTYRVGVNLSAATENQLIEDFNKEYEGKYKVIVEELPSDQAYVDKMKVLAASGELPDIIEGKDGIRELAIKNGQAIDLTEYVNADAEYKEVIGEDALKANTIDGKLYSIANARQLIGYFYNRDLFEQAGVEPAKTWDGFMSNNETLLAAGITPMSMMTGENCWATNLLLGAMIGTANDEGNTFMNTKYPATYATPEVIESLERMQTILSKYTTKDALGSGYATAANHFLQGKTAMMMNGTWMAADFVDPAKAMDGFNEKVGIAMYPNDGLYAQYEVGYMVCSKDKAKQDAAFEFIKYKTNREAQLLYFKNTGTLPLISDIGDTEEFKAFEAENPLIADMILQSDDAKYTFNTLDNISYSSVIGEMSKTYPSLTMDDITAEEMAELMTKAAAKSK